LILLLILLGIALQEVFGGGIRTSYMALTLGAAFLFIHTNEFSQQKSDERIEQQKVLITTDALTGLMSRYAYSMALNNFNNEMPKDMVAFSIDINGLKEVNDNLGHDAGDELIQGASSCIEKFFPGCAYRTGGDEFVALSRMNRKQAETITESLNKCVKAWHGNKVESMHLAIGFALAEENKDANCEELVIIADKMMYEAKSRYYKESGKDRWRR
jgi:diguanylate cyclase (GGDEF)-like protein